MKSVSLFGLGTSDRVAGQGPQATVELDPRGATMCLKRHQHLQIRSLRGWTLHAIGGALWITQDGDRHDTIVEPGESLRIEREAPVVIGALADGGVTLVAPVLPLPLAGEGRGEGRPAVLPLSPTPRSAPHERGEYAQQTHAGSRA